MEKYEGRIPEYMEDLLEIQHIGPYTAGAILCFGYGKPVAIVDSNV
jgi:A/G-specific adenine glycosylase